MEQLRPSEALKPTNEPMCIRLTVTILFNEEVKEEVILHHLVNGICKHHEFKLYPIFG
jgi:hypothetical protein